MNPEQSNPLVLVPPHTYGIPERFFAISRTAVLCVGADAARVDFLVVGFFWVWRCVFFGDAVGGVLRRGWGVGVWAAGGVAGREGAGVCWLAEGAG